MTPAEKWVAARVYAHQGVLSFREIATQLGVSPSTVSRYLAPQSASAPRCGKKRGVPRSVLRRRALIMSIVQETVTVISNRGKTERSQKSVRTYRKFPSVRAVAREMGARGHTVSFKTVQRDLHASGMTARKKQRGPRRMVGDAEKRIEFSEAWLKRTDDMPRILFSDEKICDTNDHGSQYEWCRGGEEPSRMEREKFSPRIHVWGCIGVGVKVLVKLDAGSVTMESYRDQCLKPIVKLFKNRIFQQDGAKPHNGQESLIRHHGAELLASWPPRSPDLSPIERIWAIIQQKVDKSAPANEEQLWKFWKREWDAIDQRVVDSLVWSFADGLRECVAVKGRTISWGSVKAKKGKQSKKKLISQFFRKKATPLACFTHGT